MNERSDSHSRVLALSSKRARTEAVSNVALEVEGFLLTEEHRKRLSRLDVRFDLRS